MFSYYGSKSKIVDYYPPPKHKKIIEPFAGSARYSLKYWQNDITIVDKYDVIVKIWKYLQQSEKTDIIDLHEPKLGETITMEQYKCEGAFLLMSYVIKSGTATPAYTVCKNRGEDGQISNIKKTIANQLFKIKHWKIIHGSYEDLQNEDATWFIDPPYGIGANKMTLGNGKKKIYRGQADWDNTIPTAEYWDQLFRVSKNQVVWGGNYMTEFLKPTGAWLFWDKGTGENDFADGELAWTSYNGALRKITKSWVGANAKDGLERIHPTQKPIYLYRWILNRLAKQGFKILDTHGGSMSIAKACEIEGFDLDICEIDSEYFQAGVNAFNLHKRQARLF